MALLVCLTGAIGFLTSYFLLHLGITTLWVRYLASMVIAYISFLFLLWIWAKTHNRKISDGLDAPDIGSPSKGGHSKDCEFEGKGGDFGGGGSSASYHSDIKTVESPQSGVSDLVPDSIELEELAIPVIVIVSAILLLGSSLLVIMNAPVFLAELILDGILTASLYRRLRGLDHQHWLETAFRKTALPFAGMTVILVTVGWTIQWLDPTVTSLAAFLSHRR